MAETPSRNTVTNYILGRLSVQDFGRLAPHLEAVDLPLRKIWNGASAKSLASISRKAASPRSSLMATADKPLRSA